MAEVRKPELAPSDEYVESRHHRSRTLAVSVHVLAALILCTLATFTALVVLLVLRVHTEQAHVATSAIFDPSRSWGHFSRYSDNSPEAFDVTDVGLPATCQIVQVHILQHSAQRLPESYASEGGKQLDLMQRLTKLRASNAGIAFTGPLAFMNNYEYALQPTGALTRSGKATELERGVAAWNAYGRMLYSNDPIRSSKTTQPFVRVTNSTHTMPGVPYWLAGFCDTVQSSSEQPNISIAALTSPSQDMDLVTLSETYPSNNTLAPYLNCPNSNTFPISSFGELIAAKYANTYLLPTLSRLQSHFPPSVALNTSDLYTMQQLCVFETNTFGTSPFCSLFTPAEWAAYELTMDQLFYYDFSYGNSTGRAQGMGYLQELLARLQHHVITLSDSSVNATIDDTVDEFPLDRKMYVDFTHSNTIVSVLTAMSMDWFKDPPGLGQAHIRPRDQRRFVAANIVPAGANLVTEVITCEDEKPLVRKEVKIDTRQEKAWKDKFVRMRLNGGILPLSTIRGGDCGERSDGMCELGKFVKSQNRSYERSHFVDACYGHYVGRVDMDEIGEGSDGTTRK